MSNQTFVFGPTQEKWLKSLEDNPERQMKDSLGEKDADGSYHACCLGEYLICAGKAQWKDFGKGQILTDGKEKDYRGEGFETHADSELLNSWEELGLHSSGGSRETGFRGQSLAQMNDTGYTWPEIAAEIRKTPEAWLTKSV